MYNLIAWSRVKIYIRMFSQNYGDGWINNLGLHPLRNMLGYLLYGRDIYKNE